MIRIQGTNAQNLTLSEFLSLKRVFAKAAGIQLDQMRGYGGQTSWEAHEAAGDMIVKLLTCSDTGGFLSATDALFCGYRLQKLLEEIPSEHPIKHKAVLLVDNMITSAILSKPLFINRVFTH